MRFRVTWRFRGSYQWGYKGSFRGPFKGLYRDLGFRVVISGVIGPLTWVITIVTLLITTHEPPSRAYADLGVGRHAR